MKLFNLTDKSAIELSQINTELSIERTYLALLRTSAIFIGISLLLNDKYNMKLLSLFISLFCLIINIMSNIYYSKIDSLQNTLFEKNIPQFYSYLIIIILFSLIVNSVINYIKILKTKK
jgi:uncharacterized membrane protein YidH (DUF202 family)